MAKITLSSKQLDELKKLASDSLPMESCALLAGTAGKETVVREVITTGNADRSEVSFSITPEELLNAYMKAESLGLEIIGIFHSHPAPARPSGKDAEYMELNPVPWVIMSTTTGEVKAFVYDDGIHELDLVVT